MHPGELLWLIPFLPLFGALFNGVTGRRFKNPGLVDWVALGTVGIAFLISVYAFGTLFALPPTQRSITQELWTWVDFGNAKVLGGIAHNTVGWAYRFDPLSGAMALLVTGVGFLIHLFSTGYMATERRNGEYYRFMAYMNLFVFSMLNLVLGANLLMMFLGWEGVGLCSYLLIGFYFDKETAASAGKKAFVTNRIGDFGFMIGFFLLFMIYGSADFSTLMGMTREILAQPGITLFGLSHSPTWWFNLAGCCLFVGACGKSAQIPLYVWLPDAMAGPTPVSALIHAATMVTSGLYMIARLNFVYINAPLALSVILFTGALTALVAASIGLAQYDIKKVLAYSTVSQLGFMFMGMGAGAFTAGMFHVFTHAFFKAALFLGSGSVIMACHHEQDMRNMGGLKDRMPWTFRSMAIATLAIAGIFPLSGFFSKDEILWKVLEPWYHGGHFNGPVLNLLAWLMGMAAAFMTAFYMMRLMVMTFYGQYRGGGADPHGLRAPEDPHAHHDHHSGHREPYEVYGNMWVPVAILAALAAIAGFLNVPESLGGSSRFSEWLSPLIFQRGAEELVHGGRWLEWLLMLFAVLWAGAAMYLAWIIYARDPSWSRAKAFVTRFPTLFRWVNAKYYVDEFYELAFIQSCIRLSEGLWIFDAKVIDGLVNRAASTTKFLAHISFWIDTKLIDGLVNFTAWLLQQVSAALRKFQNGRAHHYAFVMFVGFLVFALWKFLV